MNRRAFLQSLASLLPAPLLARLPIPTLAVPVDAVTPAVKETLNVVATTVDPTLGRGVMRTIGARSFELTREFVENGIRYTSKLLPNGVVTDQTLERVKNNDFSDFIEIERQCAPIQTSPNVDREISVTLNMRTHSAEHWTLGNMPRATPAMTPDELRDYDYGSEWGHDDYEDDDTDDDDSEPYDW